ncbi:hypothetical protein [Lacisediminihabitans profunda]|uniref:hypothetical protein n=1 Tax=Lacisediminihabitans profunda TaxID=2594790 RepID=UPI00164F673B|nr:hypothetical protein [Lacisediminihabitans profunda]
MKIVAFVIALALFVGGLLLFGYAFEPGINHGLVFFGGVVSVALALAVPVHVLKRIDG